MSEFAFKVDPDRVTIGFLYDLEEAASTSSLRKLIDLYVNELGLDRLELRKMKAGQLKELGDLIKAAVNVGNAIG